MYFPAVTDNIHLLTATTAFGSLAVPASAVSGLRNLVLICFTNRSGSWLLADLLQSTKQFRVLGECLNGNELAPIVQARRIRSFAGFFEQFVVPEAVDGNVVLKCAVPHLAILGQSGVLEHLGDRVRYVHIERLDRLAQAISWEIAAQTQHWSSHRAHLPAPEPVFRREAIGATIETFAECNRQFDQFFGHNGLVPHHVTYEALVQNPSAVAEAAVAGILPAGVAVDPAQATFQRQAGARNADWRRRYLEG